ncbi:MAG: RNA polymerase sigma factor [Solirubrobacteraceae bacterium]
MPVSDDPTTQPTDAQIVAASLRDPTQFALIFDRHYGAVRSYLERRAGRALAEELASEVFLQAFAGRDSYDQQRTDARPWLFGIATNLVRKHARSEERRRRAYARSVDLEGDEGGLDGLAARADAAAQGPAIAAAVSRLAPATATRCCCGR